MSGIGASWVSHLSPIPTMSRLPSTKGTRTGLIGGEMTKPPRATFRMICYLVRCPVIDSFYFPAHDCFPVTSLIAHELTKLEEPIPQSLNARLSSNVGLCNCLKQCLADGHFVRPVNPTVPIDFGWGSTRDDCAPNLHRRNIADCMPQLIFS